MKIYPTLITLFIISIHALHSLALTPIPPEPHIVWRLICDLNNPPDDHGHGDIDYSFSVSASEITNVQFALFLNHVATKSDKHKLYHPKMAIERTYNEKTKEYMYTPSATKWNHPVTYIDTPTAMRYVNWLENGKPDTFEHPQDLDDATEKGTYELSKNITGLSYKIRKPESRFALINLDEWTKIAYYNEKNTYNYYIDQNLPSSDTLKADLNCCGISKNLKDYHELPQEGKYEISGLSGNALEILEDYIPAGTYYKKYSDETNPAPTGGRFVRGGAYNIPETTQRSYLHRSHYKVRGECENCRDHAENIGFRIIYRYPTNFFCTIDNEEL